MGNLANMGAVQEMSNFTDEPEAIVGYTSVCEEHVATAIYKVLLEPRMDIRIDYTKRVLILLVKGTTIHEKVVRTSV